MTPRKPAIAPLVVAGLVLLAACGGHPSAPPPAGAPTASAVHDSEAGLQRCGGVARAPDAVVAAFDSTAATVAVWHENLAGGAALGVRSPWRSDPPSMAVTVCYLDGPWAVPGPPQSPPYDRGVVMVGANGIVVQGSVGYQSRMRLARPYT